MKLIKCSRTCNKAKACTETPKAWIKIYFTKSGKIVAASVVIRVFVCYNDRNRVGGSELASAGDTGS